MWIIFPWHIHWHSFLILSHFSFSQRASSTDKRALWVSLLSWEQKHSHIIAHVFVWILFTSNYHAERKYWGVFLFYRPFFHPRGVFQDVHVGNLKVNSKYGVSVGAYGWAGEGRPSVPRDVSTASHGKSMWVERRFFLMGRLSNGRFSFIILLTEVVVCHLRSVHATVASHAARRHGCVWHRAGPVVAARRERGQRARASLPGGLHQVSPGQLTSRVLVLLLHPSSKPLPCLSLLSAVSKLCQMIFCAAKSCDYTTQPF